MRTVRVTNPDVEKLIMEHWEIWCCAEVSILCSACRKSGDQAEVDAFDVDVTCQDAIRDLVENGWRVNGEQLLCPSCAGAE